MSSWYAPRALGMTLCLLLVAPGACKDDGPAPPPPISTGGKGGSRSGGSGGRPSSGGAGGAPVAGAGGMTAAGGSAGSDAAAVEGGADVLVTDAEVGGQADGIVPDVGGDGQAMPMRSFYSHPTYPAGAIRPNKPQPQLDGAVSGFHRAWKTRFVANGCGGSYVRAGSEFGAGLATVSEIQGYGMIVSVLMAGADDNAKATFDGMFRFARMWKSTNNPALLAHRVQITGSTCRVGAGEGGQTDGDLDIAFALLLADKQWGSAGAINYQQEARNMLAAIKQSEMNATTKLPLLGDWVTATDPKYYGARTSDFIVDHFRAFAGLAPADPIWMQGVDAVYTVINKIQVTNSPMTGLLPDFVISTNTNAAPAPAMWEDTANDGNYFYHAARIPLRLAMDYVGSAGSEARAKGALTKINEWIKVKTGNNPAAILDGYRLDGANIGAPGMNWLFEGPFGAAAIVDAGNQAWLDAIWNRLSTGDPSSDVGTETIRLLSMLVISGHWWAP